MTVPLPGPLPPLVIVIQELLFTTVHGQPLAAVTATLPEPPFCETVRLIGRMENPFTVSVASEVVEVPHAAVKTARYLEPFLVAGTFGSVSVVVAAVGLSDGSMSVKAEHPAQLSCHFTVVNPLAAAVKLAVAPAQTVRFDGLVVISGHSLLSVRV